MLTVFDQFISKRIGWATLVQAECLAAMRCLPDNCVDSVVTDPPYGLSFMGKKWDYDVPDEAIWRECLRVLKPGGHLLSFAGTRTQHRMAVRIEDAGFEIRDMIAWVYGSGFPKSRNVAQMDMTGKDAEQWAGWGTALKPSLEPITVSQKPFRSTVAHNLLTYGVGALNVDACRVPTGDKLGGGNNSAAVDRSGKHEGWQRPWMQDATAAEIAAERSRASTLRSESLGRWPANLIHDGSEEVLAAFPQAPGQMADASSTAPSEKTSRVYGRMARQGEPSADSDNNGTVGFKMKPGARRLDAGSAARFFYCAKASKSDRGNGNTHPTVKPSALMEYLVQLVTPKGGIVLDPFAGSGTTGVACINTSRRFIGIEMEASYFEIACGRIAEVDEL